MDLRGPVHRGAAVPLPASWREGGKDGESREWLLLLLLVLVLVLLQRCSLFVLYCPGLFFCCYYHTLSSLSTYLALRRCTLFYSSLVLCLCSNCLPTTGRCVDPRLLALVHLAPHFQDPALLLRSGRAPYQSPAVPAHRYQTIARPPQVPSCGTHPPSPLRSPLDTFLGFGQRLAVCLREGREDSLLRFHPRPSLPEPRFRLTAQPLRDV
jgi:hypothetical protein